MAQVINKKNVQYVVLWLGKTISGMPVSREIMTYKNIKEALDKFYLLVDNYNLVVWREDNLNNLIIYYMADGEIDGETAVVEVKTLIRHIIQ